MLTFSLETSKYQVLLRLLEFPSVNQQTINRVDDFNYDFIFIVYVSFPTMM